MYIILILISLHVPNLIYILIPGFLLRIIDGLNILYQLFWRANVIDIKTFSFPPTFYIKIKLKKSHFRYKPGEFCYISIPQVQFTSRPFSILTSPYHNKDEVTIYIQVKGNWSKKLLKYINTEPTFCIIYIYIIL